MQLNVNGSIANSNVILIEGSKLTGGGAVGHVGLRAFADHRRARARGLRAT
jgi:hypothetical protein